MESHYQLFQKKHSYQNSNLIFLWTKNIVLSEAQKKNLIGKSKNGLEKALKF